MVLEVEVVNAATELGNRIEISIIDADLEQKTDSVVVLRMRVDLLLVRLNFTQLAASHTASQHVAWLKLTTDQKFFCNERTSLIGPRASRRS